MANDAAIPLVMHTKVWPHSAHDMNKRRGHATHETHWQQWLRHSGKCTKYLIRADETNPINKMREN